MKIRIADRILVALAGLLLIALAAGVVAQTVFDVEITALLEDMLTKAMKTEKLMTMVIAIGIAVVLVLLGLYCLGVLVRHEKKGKRGFVLQKTDVGELSISIKAIAALVQKCVDRHEEITVLSTALETVRDGLVIKLRISLAGGVNIPLAVSAIQRQIKQYVTDCSGVDVKEVKVQVETADADGPTSRYTVALLPEKAEPLPVVATEEPAAPAEPAPVEEKRPLHQRLFSAAEEPVIVPVPPMAEPAAEEVPAAEKIPAEEAAPVEEAPAEEPALQEEEVPAAEETTAEEETPAEETACEECLMQDAAETEELPTAEQEEKHEDAE